MVNIWLALTLVPLSFIAGFLMCAWISANERENK